MVSPPAQIRYGALALRPGGGGVATYAREFLHAAAPLLAGADLSAVLHRDAVGELPPQVRPLGRPVTSGALRAGLGLLPVGSCDLMHSLDVDLPTRTGSALTVATVHDMSVFDTPWAHSRFRALGEQQLLRRSLRRADVVLSVSEFTAERVRSILGRDSAVVHLAPASWAVPPTDEQVRDVRLRLALPTQFLLQVGTVEPRKNVALVADVARALDLPCVLAGAGSEGPNVPAGAIGLGYVAVADLPALYSAATVVIYASRYEGFGLPPVEAMACGAAVVASGCGALPQVVGDGAILVSGQDVGAWTEVIRPLASDPGERAGLRIRAIAAIAPFTWARTATQSVAHYRAAGARV